MELLKLKIRNFKGIDNLEIEPFGEDVAIYGDNGTGKTTVADAIQWLLYGKDSLGKADFEIKPHNIDGKGFNCEVSAEFATNGEPFELKKSYYEKWTKKRGSATAEFTGNTTDYHIDNVPVKLKEYSATIAEIADDETARMLTNARYFNETMHWTDRRRILLKICGNVTDLDVVTANPELKEIPDIIGKHTVEKYKKIIASSRKQINDDINGIPTRIDEANNAIAKVEKSPATLKALIKSHEENLTKKESELNRVENGAEVTAKTKELNDVEGKVIKAENALNRVHEAEKTKKHTAMLNAKTAMDTAINANGDRSKQADTIGKSIAMDKTKLPPLRKEMDRIKAEQFEPAEAEACPTCGQDIPEDQIEAANQKALESFNLGKAQMTEDINKKGRKIHGRIQEQKKELDDLIAEMEAAQAEIDDLESAYLETKAAYDNIEAPEPTEELTNLKAKRDAIQAEIDALEENSAPKVEKLNSEIEDLKKRIDELKEMQLQHDQNKKQEKRIDELKAQERTLAAEYEELERQLYLIEEFTRAKVAMLDEQINAHFKLCKWRLTEDLINGGLQDVCIVTSLDGVGYWSVNNALRVNIGLEICQVIAKYKGVTLPVIIDNAESVTDIYKTDAQQIKLVVSEPDKTLRVEVAGGTKKKAA